MDEHAPHFRLQPQGFQCGERIEQEDGVRTVIFHCNLPSDGPILEFGCREPSCGALEEDEHAATFTDEDYVVDPNFFDDGYTMAGKTGFKVWTGTRLLIEALAWKNPSDYQKLTEIQNKIKNGARVLELGSGVGVIGTYLAATGASVLLTDLPTLVENAIKVNLLRNHRMSTTSIPGSNSCPTWLEPNGVRIGKGWANACPLDWTIPVKDQLTEEQMTSIDFIIASDVVFLVEMLNSLLDTVSALFKASRSRRPSFILSFQRRDAKDGNKSQSFTTVDGILASVRERGWTIECLAWRFVTIIKDSDEGLIHGKSQVFVFEIQP